MSGPRFCQNFNISEGFAPVDTQTAANPGDWFSMKLYNHVAVVYINAVGIAGDDSTLTIEQATTAAGGGNKALTFTDIMRKQAATNLQGTGSFTHTTQAAANTYTHADSAEQGLIWVVEFDAADLDVDNGFCFVQGAVNDTGAGGTQPGVLFYIGCECRYPQDLLPSALA